MFKFFAYFKDHTCPDPTVPKVYVLTLVILVHLRGSGHLKIALFEFCLFIIQIGATVNILKNAETIKP